MAKERSKFQRKLDGFLRYLFFDENGRPKSANLLYSFVLAILYVVIYTATYLLLLGPLENLLKESSVTVRNIAEYLVPALVGSIPCLLMYYLLRKNKQVVAGAYTWMAILTVGAMLFELVLIDWSDAATEYGLFMAIIGLPAIISVVCGGIPALILHRRDVKKYRAAEKEAEAKKRPSYYNT